MNILHLTRVAPKFNPPSVPHQKPLSSINKSYAWTSSSLVALSLYVFSYFLFFFEWLFFGVELTGFWGWKGEVQKWNWCVELRGSVWNWEVLPNEFQNVMKKSYLTYVIVKSTRKFSKIGSSSKYIFFSLFKLSWRWYRSSSSKKHNLLHNIRAWESCKNRNQCW